MTTGAAWRTGCGLWASTAIAAAAAVWLLSGCGSAPPDRSEVLAEMADEVIVAAYERFAADALALQSGTAQLCDTLTPSALRNARSALASARSSWAYSESMRTGPVAQRRSWAVVRWPVAIDEIEELIDDRGFVADQDSLANRIGADQRGLGAVEYVLHAPVPSARADGETGETSVLTALEDQRRCDYLEGLAAVIASEAAVIVAGWTEASDGADPHREQFSAPDGDGLDSVVNDALAVLESITDLELGAALGSMGRPASPEAISEGPAGAAVSDILDRIAGVQAVLVGGPKPGQEAAEPSQGLAPLLGDDLAARLRESLSTATTAAARLQPPLRTAVVESPEEVAAARDAIKAVQVMVATEVVGRLGVRIGFSDADGDSAG